jgi:hypothetical protein
LTEDAPDQLEVDRFILDHFDSVPHLEALLLLWQGDLDQWTVEIIAKRLWIDVAHARSILQDLVRDHFIVLVTSKTEQYRYSSELKADRLLRAAADAYRGEMVRISAMIHAKPSSAVRAITRAFLFAKEQE